VQSLAHRRAKVPRKGLYLYSEIISLPAVSEASATFSLPQCRIRWVGVLAPFTAIRAHDPNLAAVPAVIWLASARSIRISVRTMLNFYNVQLSKVR
jgi:hypothetical protein